MNYEQQVQGLLVHLANNMTPEGRAELVKAQGTGIARIVATIPDHDRVHQAVDGLAHAIHLDACAIHKQLHPAPAAADAATAAEVSAEDFLRNHFKPERFHG